MTERSPRTTSREPAPTITLQALRDIGDHLIVAWPSWFAGKARRLDRLLDQYGYERQSRIAWQRSADDGYSIAMARAYDRDSEQVVDVAVVGRAAFLDFYGGPARVGGEGGGAR